MKYLKILRLLQTNIKMLMFYAQMAATTRNVFIANLALADLLLCLFTIPLTLIDLVNKYWGLAPGMVRICLCLCLCLVFVFVFVFTIPLTLIDMVNKYWGLAPCMVRNIPRILFCNFEQQLVIWQKSDIWKHFQCAMFFIEKHQYRVSPITT